MHVYVHVPFCARRCSYCDFAIAVRRVIPDDDFAQSIVCEWRRRAPTLPQDTSVRTIYFGGGTPSRVAPATLGRILDEIRVVRPVAADVEVTLEANPDDVTPQRAAAWVASGVNRVSLGVQSHDAGVLLWMHRTHRAEQVPVALHTLRDAGITNLSMDLIFAVPDALQRDWSRDVDMTLALEPEHISLYGLTVEPHTPLSRWTERGTCASLSDERYADEYLDAHRAFIGGGFEHYEVSNAGRPGFRSLHNAAYWSGVEYIGLGPSAHSLLRGVRSWNVRDWAAYQRANARGEPVEAGREELTAPTRALEQRYLGLRTRTGVPVADLDESTWRTWCANGWATTTDGVVRLTPEGWLRLDALVVAAPDS